eukprot:TRINITY_DN66224_c9_g3_i2.p1 TRINITY_DN66224_c9_g3~~TRINITY_DN66224_c9_g3_i2.p1  ORF type:complete len:1410 (+),score=219.44 TRINITY_DN66224_c9_g3_i2:87-4316(+)
MALFFNFKTQQGPNVKAGTLQTEWHPEMPLLAVATDNFVVSIYNEEGDKADANGITRANQSTVCTQLAWHPKMKLLCMGWADGAFVFWSEEDGVKDASPVHTDHAITLLLWNPSGTRLVSADKSGQIGVWKLDAKHKIIPMVQYKKLGPITHAVFRTPKGAHSGDDAMLGDLGMEDVEADDKGNNNPAKNFNKDCMFFFGGSEGIIYMADDNGNAQACTQALESPLAALLYYAARDGVVCVTTNMNLGYWTLQSDFKFHEITHAKIAASQGGEAIIPQVMWVGNGLLVTSNNENVLRMWNLEQDDNYVLQLTEQEDREVTVGRKNGLEKISCISFNPRKRVLAGGTKEGRIVFWQFVGGESSVAADDWEAFAEIDLDTAINDIQWGPGETLLSASMTDAVSILHETILKRKLLNNTAIIQLSPECVLVDILGSKMTHQVKSGLRIKGLDLFGNHFCVWNGKCMELYQVAEGGKTIHLMHKFETLANCVALHSESIFIAKNGRIEVYTYQIHKKQTLMFPENEGSPEHMDVHGDHLAVVTSNNFLKMWRLGREAKPTQTKRLFEDQTGVEVTSIRCNCDGNKVSLLCKTINKEGHTMTDTKFYVYDLETERLTSYDFNGVSRFPISHCWDETEPKLLGCETRRYRSDLNEVDEEGERSSRIEVATLFASPEKGVVLQDSLPLDRNVTALIGLSVPNLYFYARFSNAGGEGTGERDTHIDIKPMPNFDGINITDPKVKDALLRFSYYLTIGNMDEAYKSVKQIKDQNVWQNMAVMCVKTKRLDVAEVCLANIQDAVAARALREARKEPEIDARVAVLAIHLGLLEEAERLYRHAKRYDLLNQMYQACGKWDFALQTAEKHDRIHLRTIHYNNARHYEALGDLENAKSEYEASRNHKYEVPRMLYDAQHIVELENYITNANDKELLSWWAQYNESNAHFDQALVFYEKAQDTLSRVRLHCYMQAIDVAAEIVNDTNNPAAAFHLARQYEDTGNVKESIHYFTIAKAYKHAIHIARDNEMEKDVMNLALLANDTKILLDCADYFESKGMNDKAVLLYQKGGNLNKAIQLCAKGKLFEELTIIAENLEADADEMVFMRCAEFFMDHGKHDKACQMFINAKVYERALQLCLENNVHMTEDMAERMTLPKTNDDDAEGYRISLLKKIAKVAKLQESYYLACKKYTQAGDKVKAMKALLKSGDKDKIILFASHSRHRDIYILAANFLQTLDWHNDAEIMKYIISFYSKARALESLAGFYDACAQVEIDEYRDYEKALAALRESYNILKKAKSADRDSRMESLKSRITNVEKFVEARKLVKSNPEEMVTTCRALLEENEIELSIRVGDVYALLVEFYTSQQDHERAYNLIENMRDKNIVLDYYLDKSLVETVFTQMGIPLDDKQEDEDAIGEDIGEYN